MEKSEDEPEKFFSGSSSLLGIAEFIVPTKTGDFNNWYLSGMFEDSSKYLEIAGVSALLAEHPILCSPKEVSI